MVSICVLERSNHLQRTGRCTLRGARALRPCVWKRASGETIAKQSVGRAGGQRAPGEGDNVAILSITDLEQREKYYAAV